MEADGTRSTSIEPISTLVAEGIFDTGLTQDPILCPSRGVWSNPTHFNPVISHLPNPARRGLNRLSTLPTPHPKPTLSIT